MSHPAAPVPQAPSATGTPPPPIEIRPFQPADAPAFFSLNEQWITRHFGMEERDHLNLGNPQQTILDPGGHILMAFAGPRAVGCCALIPEGSPHTGQPAQFELAKMAVAEDLRGQGIGRLILLATVALARTLGACRLTLGSNSRLANAVHLYQSIGFLHVPPERRPPFHYSRCDVYMELDL